MPKKNNKGFSMVEIIISVAIFAVLMIPIVSGIISSMKNTTTAKTLQYRNEFAENVMEYVKEESLVNILSGTYLKSVGSYSTSTSCDLFIEEGKLSYDSSLTDIVKAVTKAGGSITPVQETQYNNNLYGSDRETYPYETYTITGNVKLGTDHKQHVYKMEISNERYAEKEAEYAQDSKVFSNPNNLKLGVVEDLDYNKVALINGTIANYDSSVSNAFLTKKIEVLKEVDPDWYDIYTSQATSPDLFPNDTVTRMIIISVTGSESKGYTVQCKLRYHDNCETRAKVAAKLADYYIEYAPFEYNYEVDSSTGKAKLPNIYLMYNVCVYNGKYSPDDYIVMDTSGVEDDTKVKCFVVETAEKFSTSLLNAEGNAAGESNLAQDSSTAIYKKKDGVLYNDNVYTADRNSVNIHMLATKGSTLSNMSIYHNFEINTSKASGQNKKNSGILYNSSQKNVRGSLSSTDYVPLVTYDIKGNKDASSSVDEFNSLESAKEESRGLYDVKLWIQEGTDVDSIDTTKKPTMTATKGGNES